MPSKDSIAPTAEKNKIKVRIENNSNALLLIHTSAKANKIMNGKVYISHCTLSGRQYPFHNINFALKLPAIFSMFCTCCPASFSI